MRHHSRIVRSSWGGSSAPAPPAATQPCAPAPQLVSVAPSRASPAHQSLLAVPCVALQVDLRALAVREDQDPSAPKEDCHQGCDVPRHPVKFWARRGPRDPQPPWRVPRPKPKPRRHPPHRLAALGRPAAASLAAAPVRVLVAGAGARSGMIRHAWSSCGVAVQPASSAPRFTLSASMTKM